MLVAILIGGGVILLVIAWWVVRSLAGQPSYASFFQPAHVVELSRILSPIRAASLANVQAGDEPPPPAALEAQRAMSSQGLRILYTVTSVQDRFIHHYSLSVGSYTPHAVGRTFGMVVGRLLGLDPAALQVARSNNAVWHLVAELSAEEQARFVQAAPPELGLEAAAELLRECTAAGHKMELGHIQVSLPPQKS